MSRGRRIFCAVLFCAALLLDQFTKYLAAGRLKGAAPRVLIPGVLQLQYLENRGAAFGMLQNRQWIFIAFALVMILVCAVYVLKLPAGRRYDPLRLCLVFLGAGAAGNLADRIVRGYVVDFIYVSAIDFPVFNVADIYVSCSVVVLVILVLFVYNGKEDEEERKG